MAKHRTVNTHFWDDPYIETLNPNEILLFLFLITNPLTNIAGSYEITLKRMSDMTRLPIPKIVTILEKFEADGKFIYKDNWMLAVNAIKHQKTETPSIRKGIEQILATSPQWVRDRVYIVCQGLCIEPPLLILFNSIQSNSMPDGDRVDREVEEKTKTPPPTYRPAPPEIDTWLDAVARAVGAKDRQTLPKLKRWQDVCLAAIKEDRQLEKMITAIEAEKKRLGSDTQFFTPEAVLQRLQMNGFKNVPNKWDHEVPA